jgi:hypothetical protein
LNRWEPRNLWHVPRRVCRCDDVTANKRFTTYFGFVRYTVGRRDMPEYSPPNDFHFIGGSDWCVRSFIFVVECERVLSTLRCVCFVLGWVVPDRLSLVANCFFFFFFSLSPLSLELRLIVESTARGFAQKIRVVLLAVTESCTFPKRK